MDDDVMIQVVDEGLHLLNQHSQAFEIMKEKLLSLQQRPFRNKDLQTHLIQPELQEVKQGQLEHLYLVSDSQFCTQVKLIVEGIEVSYYLRTTSSFQILMHYVHCYRFELRPIFQIKPIIKLLMRHRNINFSVKMNVENFSCLAMRKKMSYSLVSFYLQNFIVLVSLLCFLAP